MNKFLLILCTFLLTILVLPVDASAKQERTITLRKKTRNKKDQDLHEHRIPSVMFTCYVEKDSGIQPLDTSEIETYEVWDCTDTAPIVIYDDEKQFVDYILNDSAEGIIKLFTPDYIYIGNLEPQFELQ